MDHGDLVALQRADKFIAADVKFRRNTRCAHSRSAKARPQTVAARAHLHHDAWLRLHGGWQELSKSFDPRSQSAVL